MNILKLIGGLIAVFFASIAVSFIIISRNTPMPEPKSPEDIVWEFLIKDKPINPEVLKNQLISYKRKIRNMHSIREKNTILIDSLLSHIAIIDSKHIAKLSLKDSLINKISDSLNNEISLLNTNLNIKNVEIVDSQNQLELLNKQIEILNEKKVDLDKKQENLKSLAKTYEAMKLKDMASILKNVDDNTVMRIYFEMKPKKRQNLLLALDQKRAANITRKLAVIEQS
jgi:flagellar motility protein MotE (MotC chaperone)